MQHFQTCFVKYKKTDVPNAAVVLRTCTFQESLIVVYDKELFKILTNTSIALLIVTSSGICLLIVSICVSFKLELFQELQLGLALFPQVLLPNQHHNIASFLAKMIICK